MKSVDLVIVYILKKLDTFRETYQNGSIVHASG